MLKQRIITAAILITITLIFLFYASAPIFYLMTALITMGAAWEWSQLAGIHSIGWRYAYIVLVAYLLFSMLFVFTPIIFYLALLWWLTALFLIFLYPVGSFWGENIVWRSVMGILTLVPAWVAINFIRNQPYGAFILLYLFILIWGADSSAYFVGKKWGRTKLAPQISPGKSWQGVFGALVFTLFSGIIFAQINHLHAIASLAMIAFVCITTAFSIVGDLFESMLKRQVGMKDSGHLLPGHGGLLDRIDSLTAAAPIFALGMIWLGK